MPLRSFFPRKLNDELFGYRTQYGKDPWPGDVDWGKWLSIYPEVHHDTQRTSSIAKLINNAGYSILNSVDLSGAIVAELGPGVAHHLDYFKGTPREYNVLDSCTDFFPKVREKCETRSIPVNFFEIPRGKLSLPLADQSQDFFLSFYSLEHVTPLHSWMAEIYRVLKPGGRLVGAIPAEGGVFWGTGRWFTSRRLIRDKYALDFRKLICWEHPNMCDEIIDEMKVQFGQSNKLLWPFPWLSYDLNLVVKFDTKK